MAASLRGWRTCAYAPSETHGDNAAQNSLPAGMLSPENEMTTPVSGSMANLPAWASRSPRPGRLRCRWFPLPVKVISPLVASMRTGATLLVEIERPLAE